MKLAHPSASRFGTAMRAIGCALLVAASAACSNPRQAVEPPLPSRADEVAAFKPVTPERWQLPNGLTVFFLRDEELPIVRGRLFIRGGSLWEPSDGRGAVGAMGQLMRQGGAGSLSADALDRELETLAAGIDTSFGAEFGGGAFSSLEGDFPKVMELFATVVRSPRFEGDRISLWKGQALESIRRRIEDPGTVSSLIFQQLLYGPTPYGRVLGEEQIKRVNRAELQKLHREFVRPDGAIMVVTGRTNRAQVEELVEKYFGTWEARGSELPAAPPVEFQPKPGIYFVQLPFSQATIQLGHLGVPRLTPDYPEIDVFNEVFGSSGFSSRLMKRVRTELGLTYGIYGAISPGVVKGANSIFAQTKAQSVGDALDEAIRVLETLQSSDATADELNEKKAAIKNSYVFNFDSADDVAGRAARLELLRYPPDYDQTYLPKIEAVTPEQVRAVAAKRWDPKTFVVVVVGNESAYSALQALLAKKPETLQGLELIKPSFDKSLVIQ